MLHLQHMRCALFKLFSLLALCSSSISPIHDTRKASVYGKDRHFACPGQLLNQERIPLCRAGMLGMEYDSQMSRQTWKDKGHSEVTRAPRKFVDTATFHAKCVCESGSCHR